jgi:hypothetical protein
MFCLLFAGQRHRSDGRWDCRVDCQKSKKNLLTGVRVAIFLFRMKYLRFSLAFIFAAGLSANAQTATTEPVGYSTINPVGGATTIVPGFVNAAVFQGPSTASGNTLSGDFTPGSMAPTSFPAPVMNFPTHYAQVIGPTNSAQLGYVFDVDSVNAQGAIVSSDIPPAMDGQTVTIVVRPHVTLSSIGSSASGLAPYTDSASIFNPSFAGGSILCLYTGEDSEGYWIDGNTGDRLGQLPIYPATGFVFNAQGGGTITTIGSVQTSKVAVPLYANKLNIAGPQQPSSADKISDLNLVDVLGGTGAYTDSYATFSTSGNMAQTATYLSDDTTMIDGNTGVPVTTETTPLNAGAVLNVSSDKIWLVPPPNIAN